jgi:immune inhibitor A
MSRGLRAALAAALAATTILGAGSIPVSAAPDAGEPQRLASKHSPHVKPLPPFVKEWQDDKAEAADLAAEGRGSRRDGPIIKLPDGEFVEHELEGTDHIITVLAEFTDPQAGQIAEPDRSVDNSTYWEPNFDRQHYEDMLFADGGGSYGRPSMRDYYLEQSSGRYTVEGQVSEWVQIDAPESEFGANGPDGDGSDNLNGPVYRVVEAALNATAGGDSGIDWSTADEWDRYDCDADGEFNEPDGYVDHFQVVHAGEGEEAGGGAQGGDAIWSHRWYANFAGAGAEGPADCMLGGYQVPGTDLWVGDYTIEPENGGVGVFAHEFGHDLGLPDLYDTAGGENGTGFWTLMSSGSWADATDPNAIGTSPVHMGAWEKFVLGWTDPAVVNAGEERDVDLGPAEGDSTGGAQALQITLPPYDFTETLVPPEGDDPNYYYSGSGDNLNNTMHRSLGEPLAADETLTFRTWYDIETDWDYAYVLYSTDGGATWLTADGNLSSDTNPNGQNFGNGITGSSGDAWVDGTYTIPAGATDIGFQYWTDGAVTNPGFIVDSIAIGDFTDDGSAEGWTFDGFTQVANGEITNQYNHYYLVESRSYVRNDVNLKGAYNFVTDLWLEKQPYADGLLVWYRNTRFADNNTSEHPGFGQVLPVDSHPEPNVSPVGDDYWRQRWQTWDSTFGVDNHKVRLSELDENGKRRFANYHAKAVKVFEDSSDVAYYNTEIPQNSVKTAGSGVSFEIIGVSKRRTTYRVRVSQQ